jgi:6-phosphogluconolactonase (cycloisomerase 2 family)
MGTSVNSFISGYAIDRTSGKLTPIAGSPFAVGCDEAISITLHPSGKFVYVNGSNGESVFAIDAASGALVAVAGSAVPTTGPTSFAIAADLPSKIAIAVSEAQANVSSFMIDGTTGALSEVSRSPLPVTSVNSVAVSPSGQFAYVANQDLNNVSNVFGFSIDSTTGGLTPLTAGPFMAATWPLSLVADPSGKFLYLLGSPPAAPSTITTYAIDTGTGALTAVNSVQIPSTPTLAIALSP